MGKLGRPSQTTPISDDESVVAARELGIDTVCIVTVGEYGGYFRIVPPLIWDSRTNIAYGVRMIDSKSGKLLLDAIKTRTTGGAFAIRWRDDLRDELVKDLSTVLARVRQDRSEPDGEAATEPPPASSVGQVVGHQR